MIGNLDGTVNKLAEFKLDKGDVSPEYDNALKIENKIKEIKSIVDNINIVPIPIGGVLLMYNNTNPSEMYNGTTWELLASDKYIRTGSTALQTGGSNSVSISKANLPNTKLKVDTFSLTTASHNHFVSYNENSGGDAGANYAIKRGRGSSASLEYYFLTKNATPNFGKTSSSSPNTGSASPSTETLGSGTALSIQPAYITLKFWKRIS